MKKVIIASLLSGAISVPVFAANENDLADANLIFNMDNGQSLELAVLSSEEMKSTEGAFLQYGLGGLAGAYGAGYRYLAGGGSNPLGFLGSVATGGATGFFSPIDGIRSGFMGLVAFGSSFSGSTVGGSESSRGCW